MSSLCARMPGGPVILRSISYWCMKDPERAGFRLQLGHCKGTCSKGTADTEYMSIKAVGPIHHYSLAWLLTLSLPCTNKLKHTSVIPTHLRPRVRGQHATQMIQPLLDIIRAHLCVGSREHGASPMRPEPLFNDKEDLAPKALTEWSFLDLFWQEGLPSG